MEGNVEGELPEDFDFLVDRASVVAPRLLGCTLAMLDPEGAPSCAGRIVEVEAYEAGNDPASHASGRGTDRNRIMFGPPGYLYVYRSYGMHWCANVVCGEPEAAGAVLIRGVEPIMGVEEMWERRPKARRDRDLASGPGKLCAALGIGGEHNGSFLFGSSEVALFGCQDKDSEMRLVCGPRIGISKATERRWRFAVGGNQHVSRPVPAVAFTMPDEGRDRG